MEDLARLHTFLKAVSSDAAARVAGAILAGADQLAEHPRSGRPMDDGRREWLVPFGAGVYVLRYRIDPEGRVVVVRVWHGREDRP